MKVIELKNGFVVYEERGSWRKVKYFEFNRESNFFGGKNTFYTVNNGKTFELANSLGCNRLFDNSEDAIKYIEGSVIVKKARLEKQIELAQEQLLQLK